jgi:ribosomal protein L32
VNVVEHSKADARELVCPRCGDPVIAERFCPGCGLDLAAAEVLPTRAEWASHHHGDGIGDDPRLR